MRGSSTPPEICTVTSRPVCSETYADAEASPSLRSSNILRSTSAVLMPTTSTGGKLFSIAKFRSMIENAELNGAQWAEKNDSRITRFGHFIRKTRIDELPQLINVLKGNMSFVGPRPERPEFVKDLSNKFQYYNLRHGIKPGITGWAQVNGRDNMSIHEKVELDLEYLKYKSFLFDIKILCMTFFYVISQDNVSH